jgi:hypothetical protein
MLQVSLYFSVTHGVATVILKHANGFQLIKRFQIVGFFRDSASDELQHGLH